MSIRPTVLNFSGNDSAGLAGLAMDLHTQRALGVHSANVITANTAQNNHQVIAINPVDDNVFTDQLKAVKTLAIKAIKVGLLHNTFQINTISEYAKQTALPLIVDPVISSSSGKTFLNDETLTCFKQNLLPYCDLLTPNIPELAILTGLTIHTHDDIVSAAKRILKMGAKAVYIKGGHFAHTTHVQDYFCDHDKGFWLSSPTINTHNTRGTGCALSSALSACAALGYSIYDATIISKMAVNQGLRQAYALEDEKGTIAISHFPNEQIDLPLLTARANIDEHIEREAFPSCWPKLGLYPVVDRAEWIAKLSDTGISTIQLRVKDLQGAALEQEIHDAVILAAKHNCRLFVNDYWELAIKYQAHGVHLGQEDLDDADIDKIRGAGLRLGTSTHCHYEVARAHAYKPSYIACGPVFHTTTKDMPWTPHGIEGLQYWREVLDYPLVAIGGINRERIPAIAKTKVDSIAMITAITLAEDPVATTKEFIELSKI